jgi:hypothetical protein
MPAAKSGADPSGPGQRLLTEILGRALVHWTSLHQDLTGIYGPLAEKWSYSQKTGHWSLQIKQKKRTILYMIAKEGLLTVGFALGEKACAAAQAGGLPDAVLEIIARAPRFAEGRGVWLDVRSKKDLENVKKVAAIKMAN